MLTGGAHKTSRGSVLISLIIDETARSRKTLRTIAGILTLTVFVNAALLFSVEPLFSKLVLPLLGGTPSVWNTCLVFFQAALLIGYAYAHLVARIRSTRQRAVVHIAVLALSCLALPLTLRATGDPPAGSAGILWLLAVLATSLGAPFVMLASGAPLLQRWLADSGHPDGANPYFLYAASNLGSLVALLSYPVLIEPWLPLSLQQSVWSVAYVVLVLLVSACALTMSRDSARSHRDPLPDAVTPVRVGDRAAWVIYSAVPASLLVGVTTFISTDVAAVPLLWVVPLSIYLLTFVIVFATRPPIPHAWMTRVEPHVLVLVSIPIFWGLRLPGLTGITAHLIVLFVVAMVCHGELARRRPASAHLTGFFVWVALGGLIGGVFNALVAPIAFNRAYEYPIVLALAAFLVPSARNDWRPRPADIMIAATLAVSLLIVTAIAGGASGSVRLLISILFGVVLFSFRLRPLRFGLALAAVFVAGYLRERMSAGGSEILDADRSFFGAYRVSREARTQLVKLHHGTTLHGAQSLVPSQRLEPLTYYHRHGPSGDVFGSTLAANHGMRRVALVGLGTGSLSCYGRRGERWTYYEIDPVVARIALDPRLFTYVRDCPPAVRIVLGDARLTLRRSAPASYDILILDAFSSDAIPVHLLTMEAFRAYLSLLAPGGVIAIHISNEHLDLEPVIEALAAASALHARVRSDFGIPAPDVAAGRAPAIWVALARSPADLGNLASDTRWMQLRRRSDVSAWTDDFSNIFRVFRWR